MYRMSKSSTWWTLILAVLVGVGMAALSRPAAAIVFSGPATGSISAPEYTPPPPPPPTGSDGGDPDEIGIYRPHIDHPTGSLGRGTESGTSPAPAPKIGTGLRLLIWAASLPCWVRGL
jgi:hypothetical protein